MGRKMLNKLRSRKGASLTFALLAFLVCAVISAVLLASASASAGRLSGLVEADQRYYAVNSAAQLFCDALKDQKFTVNWTREVVNKTTTKVVYSKGNTTTSSGGGTSETNYSVDMTCYPTESTEPTYKKGSSLETVREGSIMTEAVLYYIWGNDIYLASCNTLEDLVIKAFDTPFGKSKTWNFTIQQWSEPSPPGGGAGTATDVLPVDVDFKIETNGNITLRFRNQTSKATDPVYEIEVTLNATVTKSIPTTADESTSTTYGPITPTSDGYQYDKYVSTTETTEKSASISWTVAGVKKVMS